MDESIGFWWLVWVSDFNDAVKRSDTETESDSDLGSEIAGEKWFFWSCILEEREKDLKEIQHNSSKWLNEKME